MCLRPEEPPIDDRTSLLRAADAPAPRTLVDVLDAVVDQVPDSPALDNGAEQLTYAELVEAADALAAELAEAGVGRGDRVGVRIRSGSTDLYVAIVGVLRAGAAYVPVDVDDPEERARLVLGEAGVRAVVRDGLTIETVGTDREPVDVEGPDVTDDAWIIFTSGSTGTPKGVAVTHRSAAAFVDAESRMFLQDEPLGPGDRVMAGLSVAFDASCEEMWLAWGHGACLVPAPRSLVRSGMDLGPWLVANGITVVSTVPTLALLWPAEALEDVRLLILGGEACPPEIGARLARPGREVWNTYGPTEATVVACGAQLAPDEPVRIGLPLDGWDLAVVDADMQPVEPGETGQLVIGGVGLARYLDPAKDAEKYAPAPTLGWDRAYRSGDLVRFDGEGLVFGGRADDQVKVGGRRIELGEVDAALQRIPGVNAAAVAVRTTAAGGQVLVGYLAMSDGVELDRAAAMQGLREVMPAALVPRLAVVDTLPTRTSGKIDRDALPWPLTDVASDDDATTLPGTQGAVAALWTDVVGAVARRPDDDFFDLGGGSLAAAQVVARLRQDHPEVTIGDVYDHPTVGGLADFLDSLTGSTVLREQAVRPTPRRAQVAQVLLAVPLRTIAALRWLVWGAAAGNVLAGPLDAAWAPTVSWWWVLVGWIVLISPVGRLVVTAAGARLLLVGVEPGTYPRGGAVHLRLWAAERLADEMGAANLAGAAWMTFYARALGASVGRDVDLHALPPVTGLLTVGDGASVEPEVDLSGHWLDGDRLHLGRVEVGARARVGARSAVVAGARVGDDGELGAGSTLVDRAPSGEYWSGAPAGRVAKARGPWSEERPPLFRRWLVAYGATAIGLALLPVLALAVGGLVLLGPVADAASTSDAAVAALVRLPLATVLALVAYALLVLVVVRLLGLGLQGGHHPVHSRQAWQAWATVRVLDEARTWLFPLYSSALTPLWLRALGARIGSDVEASTVLMIPSLTTVNDGAFLADDTMIGSYELGGGWLRVERAKIGKRAFVGNSGMTAPGRKVPKQGLVAVLSAAPRRSDAKAGTSWLGSPPVQLRRTASSGDQSLTYHPATRLKVARAAVELCRVVPVVVTLAIALGVVTSLQLLVDALGHLGAALLGGLVLMAAGAVAGIVATAAKWVLVGRFRAGEHPLWSSFVWRNELADTFVEVVAATWFARAAQGSVVLNLWLRSLGATVGRGVWCETYWLPEADLITLEDGVSVNQGCVVQTHLFHDRMMAMDGVTMARGSTLGPNSVVLPAAALGRDSTVGPGSLVMRGEAVPAGTRWMGNPIGPWAEDASA
ncbi:Pls/PosA family non-ribosomal peptide synthetase [Solicola sp. PLA-1-18]|uniref:Pls/PosA family non-ribosomal peptide synthetase n=1 Tax=Solicola sp. PLA-1-18 TaxID=3380532 RepID=UPI003B8152D2